MKQETPIREEEKPLAKARGRGHKPGKAPTKEAPEWVSKRDYLAREIADVLGDQKSLGAFRTIAERIPEPVIRDCLANIKETWKEGKIRASRGALFISMIQPYSKKKGIALGFKTSDAEHAGVASWKVTSKPAKK